MSTPPLSPIIEAGALEPWELVPSRTALIVIDAQNDFLHPDGYHAQHGFDIEHMRRCIEPVKQLVAACRERDVPVIWTRHGFGHPGDGGWAMEMHSLEDWLREGGWGYQVLDGLGAQEDDRYVAKTRLSGFYETNLDLQLRALDAEILIFAGVLTNQCVAATSKDATFRDYKPIVVEEATGTTNPHLHDPALEMVKIGWGEVRNLENTLSALRELPAPK